jgi:flagellar hook-basal body complex protein FliE
MIEGLTAALAPVGLNTPQATSGVSGGVSGGISGGLGGDGSFGSVIRNAVERLEQGQRNSEQEMARAVAGEAPDLHRTVIALQTEELNLQLALQVRNKVIGAYEEIMRMQV